MASKASENRLIQREFQLKMKLEATFAREIKSLFAAMSKKFAVTVARTGRAPQASDFIPEWQSALKKHYRRTQEAFAGIVRESQGKFLSTWSMKQTEEEDEDLALFLFALQSWTDRKAPQSAKQITNTTQNNYNKALQEARDFITENDEPTDFRTLAVISVPFLRKKLNGRVETIKSFETQQAAEVTKLIEAEITAGMKPSFLGGVSLVAVTATKKWRTIGDSKVRKSPFDHVAADFQTVKINEPFIVSGQSLRTPGDTSLGASMGNVAGCRCSAVYNI